jgi:hypothetical protein
MPSRWQIVGSDRIEYKRAGFDLPHHLLPGVVADLLACRLASQQFRSPTLVVVAHSVAI